MPDASSMRVRNYGEAEARASRSRSMNKDGAPMGVRTRLVKSSATPRDSSRPVYAIRYCWSEVVRYYPTGIIGVTLSGYDTKTTKLRVKEHSNAVFWSSRGDTFVMPFGWGRVSIPVDTSSEYFVDTARRAFYGPRGEVYDKDVVEVGRYKPLPKVRKPERSMFRGDVLTDPQGQDWIVVGTSDKALYRYYGDDPNNRSYCHLGPEAESIQINDLLMMTVSAGWKAKERYVRELLTSMPELT